MARRNLEDWFWQVSGDVMVLAEASPARTSRKRFWEPKADVFEDERHFILRCELAGVRSQDIQIAYLPGRHSLLVRGVRQEEELPGAEKKGCHQLEIYFGQFERELPLPETPVEPSEMRARLENGMLYVLVPKARMRVRHVRMRVIQS